MYIFNGCESGNEYIRATTIVFLVDKYTLLHRTSSAFQNSLLGILKDTLKELCYVT